MSRSCLVSLHVAAGVLALAVLCALPAAVPAADGEAIALLNGKDLSGWNVFVDPNAEKYSKDSGAEGIFKVEDGILHVSGERFAYIITEKEYGDYRLTVEFRWGERRWPPRAEAKRDSGILYHVVGPDKIWPKSLECQIQEGDCGDFYLVGGPELTVNGERKKGGRVVKTRDAEKPRGEWNTVEVISQGGKLTHLVNGQVVNEGTDSSLTRGKILLQSEGAEIFFRKVELKPLP